MRGPRKPDRDQPYDPDPEPVWPYAFEENDAYKVRYAGRGRVAHLRGSFGTVCGANAYLGGGSWKEWEQAHTLPLCKRCLTFYGPRLDVTRVEP